MIKGNLLIYILLATIAFACNSADKKGDKGIGSQSSTSNVKQIEIKMVGQWYGQGDRERLIREFVKEYNFLHQDIKINLKFANEIYNDANGSANRDNWNIKQMTTQQSEYDIIMINNESNPIIKDEPDWPQKYLVDFSDIEEFRNTTAPGIITDSLKKKWHGIIPGPVIEGFYYAMWCNNNVAKKVGITVKQTGMTFDDFLGYVEAVYKYNKAHPNDYIVPLFEAKDWKVMNNFLNQLYYSKLNNSAEYFKDNVSEKKLNAWFETLKALERLSAYEPLCPKWDTMIWNNNYKSMLQDKFLFFPNGSWMFNRWKDVDNGNLKNIMPTEFPVFDKGEVYPGGYQIMWAVPKNAPHKDEAIKVMLAMNSSKVAEKWIRYTKCPTGIKGKLASVSMGVDHFENFTYYIQEKYRNKQITFSASQHIFGYEKRWNSNYAVEVMQRKITPEKAMEEIKNVLKFQKIKIAK